MSFSGYKWFISETEQSSIDIIRRSAFNGINDIRILLKQKSINLKSRISYLDGFKLMKIKSFITEITSLFSTFYLQKWLHRQDRTGMSNGIEIRVPFCDLNLIKYYLGLRLRNLDLIAGTKKI